ncbi:uncharacterized protein BKCO1_7000036 [Diplodia corticola]|uniref:Uncharacterized protein n=1 Tax=Diplodia corticola TaxID=236234 RepID=A0A1J9QLX9_9PEZI|nr:uncharacterized protein BKCO1_7000036 [Diplodia corticola]OJD29910.1 hypothetical protein BKCO1_7000036 [Diplodia corticola]
MPMRWSPDKDQLMFMMLLKTHNISINYGAIAEAWPSDQGEKPTPRAISERLIKIRKQVSGGASARQPRSLQSTPSKPKAVRTPASGTPSNKRRRLADDDDDDRTVSRQELRDLGIANDPRSSPTPHHHHHQPPAAPFATTAAAAAAPRRSTTVASNVLPSSERWSSPARGPTTNGEGSSSSSSSRPTLPPVAAGATTTAAAAVPAPRHRSSLSANARAFAARTPLSMEPTAGQLARLSVTPAANGGGGGGGAATTTARSTPRRGTSMAPIKLEESEGDDDDDDDSAGVLQPADLLEDDSDVSDWAVEEV